MNARARSCGGWRAWFVMSLGIWASCAGRAPAAVPRQPGQYSANRESAPAAPQEVAGFLEETADARGFDLQPDARLAHIAQLCAAHAGLFSPSQLELAVR